MRQGYPTPRRSLRRQCTDAIVTCHRLGDSSNKRGRTRVPKRFQFRGVEYVHDAYIGMFHRPVTRDPRVEPMWYQDATKTVTQEM